MNPFTTLADKVDCRRIEENLWRLATIPSPTCHEREAALAFAELLGQAGAKVEVDHTIPASPSVIGRLHGNRPGKTFQLAGHIDHVDVPHAPPTRGHGQISARGVSDMKSGLAGILEIVRLLNESGCDFPGQVLITVYGRHEAPQGDSAGLLELIKRGIVGDAALIAESAASARNKVVVAGQGQSIWNLSLTWHGAVCHELNRPREADGLLEAALAVAGALRAKNAKLEAGPVHPLLGAEHLFIGQLHYGDFYNRTPNQCTLQGTRRWNTSFSFEAARRELAALMARVICPKGIRVETAWTFVGESYQLKPREPVLAAFSAAFQTITGEAPQPAGISAVTDANRLAPLGHIPTVLCAFEPQTAHADREVVALENLRQPCQIALLTVLNFLHHPFPSRARKQAVCPRPRGRGSEGGVE